MVPRTLAELLIGLPCVVMLILLVRVLRDQRRDWTATSWAVLALGWLTGLSIALATLFGRLYVLRDSTGSPVRHYTLPGYALITHFENDLLVAGAVLALFLAIRRASRPQLVPILFVAIGLVAALNDRAVDGNAISKSRLTLFLILGAIVLMKPAGATLGAATFGLSFAGISGLAAVLHFDIATSACGTNKCGPLGILWSGLESSENSLGLILATAIPFVVLAIKQASLRVFFALYLLAMVWFTGSRTSLIGAVVVTLACLVHAKVRRGSTRRTILAGTALVGVIVGVVLPYTTENPLAYTYRGGLWLTARGLLHGNLVAGRGDDLWGKLTSYGTIPISSGYSVHNQWLDVLFDTGVLGLLMFAIALFIVAARPTGLLLLMPVIYLGLTERLIAVGHVDSFAWVLPALLLASAEREVAVDRRSSISAGAGGRRRRRRKHRSVRQAGADMKPQPVAANSI